MPLQIRLPFCGGLYIIAKERTVRSFNALAQGRYRVLSLSYIINVPHFVTLVKYYFRFFTHSAYSFDVNCTLNTINLFPLCFVQ